MIAIPLLAALLLQLAEKAPQDSSISAPSPAVVLTVPRNFTPEQQEQIKQKMEQARIAREPVRKEAIRINDLAAKIHSEADARKFVDAVAEVLTNHRHLFWAAQSFRHRVAHAEFEAVSDPSQLIPEQRIVDVWNEYVREIDAPEEALITVAELHDFRLTDVHFSRHNWELDLTQSIWSMPSIYAVDAGGNIADGCRALETLKIISNMHDQFFRVQSARGHSQKETVLAGVMERPQSYGFATTRISGGSLLGARARQDPINPAGHRYQQEHGGRAYDQLVRGLFDQLFPAE